MTDTPIQPPTQPPVSRLEMLKGFIGDLARPFAVYAIAFATARAIVIISRKVGTLSEGAIYITAVLAGLAALYGAKAWENAKAGKQAAEVEIAKVTGSASN